MKIFLKFQKATFQPQNVNFTWKIFEVVQPCLEAHKLGILLTVHDLQLRARVNGLCRPEVDVAVHLERLQVLLFFATGAPHVRHPVAGVAPCVEEHMSQKAQLKRREKKEKERKKENKYGSCGLGTIPHRVKIKPNYCPPGPLSLGVWDNCPLGHLPTKTTTNQYNYSGTSL